MCSLYSRQEKKINLKNTESYKAKKIRQSPWIAVHENLKDKGELNANMIVVGRRFLGLKAIKIYPLPILSCLIFVLSLFELFKKLIPRPLRKQNDINNDYDSFEDFSKRHICHCLFV